VLRLLGYPQVRDYDGSMREWANDLSCPIETPAHA
jgi:3-mercaptopyruvate sulfurtransferase SseA